MPTKIPMTSKGVELLRKELEQLKSVARPNVIAAISEARAHGDLKENAEYHAAKEQQGFIESRIREIEAKLSNAAVIDVFSYENKGRVIFGATVTLVNLETDVTVVYQIVGDDEADLKHHKISVSSPIARSIIGKNEGDEVVVVTPSGDVEYLIEKVEYL